MNADTITLIGLLSRPYQYVIPIFQRYYSWNKDNWDSIWEEIAALSDSGQGDEVNFMGSLVLDSQRQSDLSKPALHVIDGQQRLMTFSLVLCALRDVAKCRGYKELCKAVEETTLIDPYEEGDYRFRVYPRQRDRDSFIAAVKGDDQIGGRISEALTFFTEKVAESEAAESEEDLKQLFELIKRRLHFVHIVLEGENAYAIFQALNSTGLPLSEADLVRNFVFLHVRQDEQDHFDDVSWNPIERRFEDDEGDLNAYALSAFFRDFLMSTGTYVKEASTFQVFERHYSGTEFDPEDLAIELGWHVDNYDIIRGKSKHSSERVEQALSKLRGLHTSTTFPVLLNLLYRNEDGSLNEDGLVSCVEAISSFILRRYVCGESSRGYHRWFVSICRELEEQPLERLKAFLVIKGYPDDTRFEQCLVRFNLYQSEYARYVLETLERSYDHRESPDLSQAQIEHIMPQTLSEAWKDDLGLDYGRVHSELLHTVGNLTLSAYNPELYNHAFRIKREKYNDSNITLTRQLALKSNWGEDDILARGTELARRATEIWVKA